MYVVTVEGMITLAIQAAAQREAERLARDAVRRGLLADHSAEGHDAPEVLLRPASDAEKIELMDRLAARGGKPGPVFRV